MFGKLILPRRHRVKLLWLRVKQARANRKSRWQLQQLSPQPASCLPHHQRRLPMRSQKQTDEHFDKKLVSQPITVRGR